MINFVYSPFLRSCSAAGSFRIFKFIVLGMFMAFQIPLHAMKVDVVSELPAVKETALLPRVAVANEIDIEAVIDASPLHAAASLGDCAAVEALLGQGVDINLALIDGSTPLHLAAREDHPDLVKLLISKGANVNAAQAAGTTVQFTPLHIAAYNGHNKVAAALIIVGKANVNALAVRDITPLHCAASENHPQMITLLVSQGANVGAKCSHDGSTALHLAPSKEVVDALVKSGARIQEKDAEGKTPLHAAIFNNNAGVTEALLSHGANLEAEDNNGVPALSAGAARFMPTSEALNLVLFPHWKKIHERKRRVMINQLLGIDEHDSYKNK